LAKLFAPGGPELSFLSNKCTYESLHFHGSGSAVGSGWKTPKDLQLLDRVCLRIAESFARYHC
jgi:hypothetical protein